MINPYVFFGDLFCVLIDDGIDQSVCAWAQMHTHSKLSVRASSSRRSSLTQTFIESCVDLEVVHLSILMVWRLTYQRFLP